VRWSKREDAILIKKYGKVSWTELLQLLRGRTKKSILQRAERIGLDRSKFSTKKGVYFVYAKCERHGRILRQDIVWEVKETKRGKTKIPRCPWPYCGKRLRVRPKSSKLREKYRNA